MTIPTTFTRQLCGAEQRHRAHRRHGRVCGVEHALHHRRHRIDRSQRGRAEEIDLLSGSSVTIEGINTTDTSAAVESIDGNTKWAGFFVYNGGVTLENLTLTDMTPTAG